MKKYLALFILFVSTSCLAVTTSPSNDSLSMQNPNVFISCGHAPPTTNPKFCGEFKRIAYCHCHDEYGIQPAVCNDMRRFKKVIEDFYGSLWNACSPKVQKDASQQECFDDWNYYLGHCL